MAKYFSKLDENSVVTNIVRLEDSIATDEATGSAYLNNIYKNTDTWKMIPSDVPKGYTYNQDSDTFTAAQPFPSWTLNSNNEWEPPTAHPGDGNYRWDEATLTWII